MDREAIEEAIEVLEDASADMLTETGNENYYGEAITILRQALETDLARVGEVGVWGEWQRLTDEEVFELADTNLYDGGKNHGVLAFAKAVEQALKEKNKW